MYAYDQNGLELTPVSNSLTAYRLTAVAVTTKKYAAYAASIPPHKIGWSMHIIHLYKDPRDAAFVAQEFAKVYDKAAVRQMIDDGSFNQVAKKFCENIEIPEWKYQAEGLTIEDILGGKYKTNYVNNVKDALVEAIRVAGVKTPPLKIATKMMADVEELVKNGFTYRIAAKTVVENTLVSC